MEVGSEKLAVYADELTHILTREIV